MGRLVALSLLVVSLLGIPTVEAAPARRTVSRIVAIVDFEVITQRDVDRRMVAGQTRAAVLDALVESALLLAEAERRRVTVERAEVDAVLTEIAKGNNLTVAQVYEEAAKAGFDEASYRDEIRRQMLELRVVSMHMSAALLGSETQPTDGVEGARRRLVAELRTRSFVEVRP